MRTSFALIMSLAALYLASICNMSLHPPIRVGATQSATEGGTQVIESLSDIAPDVGRLIVEFAFGGIYDREELSLRDRELATIASLCTQGTCDPQLKVHTAGALNAELSESEIVETFIQLIPYVSFPRVLNAISAAAKEVVRSPRSNAEIS